MAVKCGCWALFDLGSDAHYPGLFRGGPVAADAIKLVKTPTTLLVGTPGRRYAHRHRAAHEVYGLDEVDTLIAVEDDELFGGGR